MRRTIRVKLKEVENLAKTLSQQLKGGEVLALHGQLGSGKTTFTKFLSKNLKVKGHVTSPTFVIMNRYKGRLNKKTLYIYHFDLYRTKGIKEAKSLGITEIWGKPDTITIIEWALKVKKILPNNSINIYFSHN